jgi:predicted membrane channel-forming protein YqfA (hemolysin III family)
MTKAPMLRIFGFTAIALAVIGSLTSLSVVRAGGTDGAVYLTVNIAVAVVGAILLLLASRGRQAQGKNPSAPSTTRAGAHPPAE